MDVVGEGNGAGESVSEAPHDLHSLLPDKPWVQQMVGGALMDFLACFSGMLGLCSGISLSSVDNDMSHM